MHDICQQLEDITKNEHLFVQNYQELFDYDPPMKMIIIDESYNEESETDYFIPIEQTLPRILTIYSDRIMSHILHYINLAKRSSVLNNDLMFFFRNGHVGIRIADDSLSI